MMKKYEQHYVLQVGMYDFKGEDEILEGTRFTCKHCNEFFKIKGAYSKLDGDKKKSFNCKFDSFNSRHKKACDKWPACNDEDAPEPLQISFNPNSEVLDWKEDELSKYLQTGRPAPELKYILSADNPFEQRNPNVTCVFRHPITERLSREMQLSSTVLCSVQEYKERVLDFLEESDRRSHCMNFLEEIIDTLERTEKYEAPKKRHRSGNAGGGMFSRGGQKVDPGHAYEALIRLLLDSISKGCTDVRLQLTKENISSYFSSRFNISDYADPTTRDCILLNSLVDAMTGSEQQPPLGGKRKGLLYVKPTALHAWLTLLSHRCPIADPIDLKLGFYHGDHKRVETDPFGFCNAVEPVNISFSTTGTATGVLCVIIGGDISHTNKILPLGRLCE
jgi:hypothetical protein